MLGLGLPLAIAVVAIPALISSLGEANFGILTIIWAVVSYFGLFDLGLGRAVTQQVATAVAAKRHHELGAIVGTSSLLMLALGLLSGMLMAGAAPLIANQLADQGHQAEVAGAFYWMALAMPAIVLTSGYRGILEAMGRFGIINIIRFPMGVFTFVGPLAAVWTGNARLDIIAAILCAGRVVACAIHAHFALRAVPDVHGHGAYDRALLRPLLGMGGWMSVSNIVSPLMSYIDRFMLGFAASAAAVAYYATPQELILRIGIVPGALAAVLFPMFAANTATAAPGQDDARHVWRYSLMIFVMMLPLTAGLMIFARPLLAMWISPDFSARAAAILQIMAVAALASGLAQVPYSMLQGQGRADITGKLHLAEFPIYVALLYVLVMHYGAEGAAWAWLLRITGDMVALYCLNGLNIRTRLDVDSVQSAAPVQK